MEMWAGLQFSGSTTGTLKKFMTRCVCSDIFLATSNF